MVKYEFRTCDLHVHMYDAEQRIIFTQGGPRIVTICSSNTAMKIVHVKPTSCDCALGHDFLRVYTISQRVKDLLRGNRYGTVVVNVRTNRISFTHDHNRLIRRVSDMLDDDNESFHIETEDRCTFPLTYQHWKQFMPMLKDSTTRVDVSDNSVTFSGDNCGAAYACCGSTPCTFEMKYGDFKFIYDTWEADTTSRLTMGQGANGILFIRGKNRLGQQCYGYMTPIS